jgi:protein involved in polysaccharide export with SLBB domain
MKGLYMRKFPSTTVFTLFFCLSVQSAIIETGSVLDILVLSHPEFSGRFTVSSKGTIEYPLLADEIITDITTADLMNDLTFKLAKHIENPLVLISLVEKPNIKITVLGQVVNPGPVEAYLGATVQEVIKLAGGVSEQADIESVKIIHKDGNDQTAEYFDLKSFMKDGKYNNMPKLQAEDIVILLSQTRTNKVKVIGAVNKPGFFDLEEKVNAFELIYLAGGPAEKADLSRVRRFFKSEEKTLEEVINVQEYIDNGDMDKIPMIEEGDVIIVYSKWFDWKIFMSILSNVLLFIVTIQSLRGAIN